MKTVDKVVMFISSIFSSHSAIKKSASKSEWQLSPSQSKVQRYTRNLQKKENKLKLVSCCLQVWSFLISFSEYLHFHKQD